MARPVGTALIRAASSRRITSSDAAGGEIDVADLEAEQRVAYATADPAGLALAAPQRVEQLVHAGPILPGACGSVFMPPAPAGDSD